MQVQINTDRNIEGHERLIAYVRGTVDDSLARFRTQITRIEVHLGDENGDKAGREDKRCMIEARLEGRPPVAVTHHAGTLEQALDGAADKLVRLLDHTLGRLRDQR